MYLTYKNWFWAHFSWFLGRGIYSTVWTRSGSKIKKQVKEFKGLMSFDVEYFQHIFGVFMGNNVAPILANIYMAKLELLLKEKCKQTLN